MAKLHTIESVIKTEGPGWQQELIRLRVDGGWLYIGQINSRQGIVAHSTFVPEMLIDEEREVVPRGYHRDMNTGEVVPDAPWPKRGE